MFTLSRKMPIPAWSNVRGWAEQRAANAQALAAPAVGALGQRVGNASAWAAQRAANAQALAAPAVGALGQRVGNASAWAAARAANAQALAAPIVGAVAQRAANAQAAAVAEASQLIHTYAPHLGEEGYASGYVVKALNQAIETGTKVKEAASAVVAEAQKKFPALQSEIQEHKELFTKLISAMIAINNEVKIEQKGGWTAPDVYPGHDPLAAAAVSLSADFVIVCLLFWDLVASVILGGTMIVPFTWIVVLFGLNHGLLDDRVYVPLFTEFFFICLVSSFAGISSFTMRHLLQQGGYRMRQRGGGPKEHLIDILQSLFTKVRELYMNHEERNKIIAEYNQKVTESGKTPHQFMMDNLVAAFTALKNIAVTKGGNRGTRRRKSMRRKSTRRNR